MNFDVFVSWIIQNIFTMRIISVNSKVYANLSTIICRHALEHVNFITSGSAWLITNNPNHNDWNVLSFEKDKRMHFTYTYLMICSLTWARFAVNVTGLSPSLCHSLCLGRTVGTRARAHARTRRETRTNASYTSLYNLLLSFYLALLQRVTWTVLLAENEFNSFHTGSCMFSQRQSHSSCCFSQMFKQAVHGHLMLQ